MTLDLQFLDSRAVKSRCDAVSLSVLTASEKGAIAIVGSAALAQKCLTAIRAAGGEVPMLIEYDPRCWGKSVLGVPVVSPDDAFRLLPPDALVVSGVWSPNHRYRETREWLNRFGFENVLPVNAVFWTFAAVIGAHYQFGEPTVYPANLSRIATFVQQLSDEASRSLVLAHLKWRVTLDPNHLPEPDREHVYFDWRLFRSREDIVVGDVGAFDGDSLRMFLRWHGNRFGCFHAFEPDPVSFSRLADFKNSLAAFTASRIKPIQAAVGESEGAMRVMASGKPGSKPGKHGEGTEVASIRLDSYFASERVDYLKFDIEGAEWEALAGAWSVIERNRPIIGLAIYHRPTDIFDLPLAIIQRTQNYRYFVRSHDDDGIDLVFYAVPAECSSGAF